MEGELPLGEYIAEERIAATLGVSRTPVREALMSLQFQGLVETAPPRGAYVFKPSYDEVVKLSEFRMFMELQALTLAAGNQLQKLLTDLRRATAAMRTAAAHADRLGYGKADAEFHDALFASCENPYLTEAYQLTSGRFDTLRNFLSGRLSERSPSPADDHDQIIDAIAEGRLEAGKTLLADHILRMAKNYKAAL